MSLLPPVFLKGTVLSAAAAICAGILAYFARRIMANHLTTEDFAFFYSTTSILNVSMIVAQFGTADVLLFEIPGLLESGRKRCAGASYGFVRRFQALNSLWLIILLVLCFPLFERFYFDYPVSLANFGLFMLALWGVAMRNTTLYTLNSLKKFGLLSILRVAHNVALLLAAVACLCTGKLIWSILIFTAVTTACSLTGDLAARRSPLLPGGFPPPGMLKRHIVRSGFAFLLLNAGNAVMMDFGTLALSICSRKREVALFNIALPIAMIVQSMLVVLNVFNPLIAECCARNDRPRIVKLFGRLFLLIAAVMLAAGAVLYFGWDHLIAILFSEKFASAKWSTIFMVEASLLGVPVRALYNLFNATDQKRISLKTLLPMGISAVTLLPLLSYLYGASGTGLAVLIATVVWLAAYLINYWRFIRSGTCSRA